MKTTTEEDTKRWVLTIVFDDNGFPDEWGVGGAKGETPEEALNWFLTGGESVLGWEEEDDPNTPPCDRTRPVLWWDAHQER